MIRDLTIAQSDGTVTILKPAPKIAWRIHKSSWDAYGKSRPTHNNAPLKRKDGSYLTGLPDVWRITEENPNGQPTSIELTEDRQHYLLYINLCAMTGKVWTRKEYQSYLDGKTADLDWAVRELTRSLTHDRSHTNFHGMDNRRNYLLKTNPEEGNPLFAKLITGRARLRLYNDTETLRNVPAVGTCVAFHCINAAGDYWQYNPITHPWLFDEPCLTGREIAEDKSGVYIVRDDLHYPYGNFDGRLVLPIWLPNTDRAFVPITLVTSAPNVTGWKF